VSRRRRDLGPQGQWNFFSFPVYFGAAVGALVSFFGTIFLGEIWFFIIVLMTSWAMAHLINRTMIRRRQERQRQREEEDERERRALEARAAAQRTNEEASHSARRRRRVRRGRGDSD
jgi:hypothetical protein